MQPQEFPLPGQNTAYLKGHGSGNDFIVLPDPQGTLDISADDVRAWCDVHTGIGADGILRIVPSSAMGSELEREVPGTQWFMDYRNADGSIAQMCGNGVRVFVDALIALGYIDLPVGQSIAIGTRSGVKHVRRTEEGYAANLGPWSLIYPQEAEEQGSDVVVGIYGLEVPRPGLSISMGNPHTVVALAHREEVEGADLAREPRVEPAPPEGSNIELVSLADPLIVDGVGRINMRVHERGVGETLSCGTGICAAASAVRYWVGKGAPDRWEVTVPGGTLEVEFVKGSSSTEDVILTGPARIVASGYASVQALDPQESTSQGI